MQFAILVEIPGGSSRLIVVRFPWTRIDASLAFFKVDYSAIVVKGTASNWTTFSNLSRIWSTTTMTVFFSYCY